MNSFHKHWRHFSIFILLLAVVLISNHAPAQTTTTANDQTTQSAPSSDDSSDDASLEVLQFLPNGHAKKLSQIVVMFNQPMAALGDFDNVKGKPLALTPELKGSFRWLNQYTLAFIPKSPPTGSLNLKVGLAAGIKSLSGAELAESHEIEIFLPSFDVDSVDEPYDNYDPEAGTKPVWIVAFNQEPDLKSLNKKAFFVDTEDLKPPIKIPAVFTKLGEYYRDNTYSAVPKKPLPKNTAYNLVIEPGLVSLSGPETTQETISVVEAKTYEPLSVGLGGVNTEDGRNILPQPDNLFSIEFNNPVKTSQAIQYIESDPPIDAIELAKKKYAALEKSKNEQEKANPEKPETEFSDQNQANADQADADQADDEQELPSGDEYEDFDLDDVQHYLFFYPILKADTEYTITVKKGLPDIYGQTLEQDQTLSLETGQYSPSAYFDTENGILETGAQPLIPVNIVNLPQATVTGYALDVAQAISCLTDVGGGSYEYMYLDRVKVARTLQPFSKTLSVKTTTLTPPNGAVDGPYQMALNLKTLFGDSLTGHLLLLDVDSPSSEYGSFKMFQVSDIGLTAKLASQGGLAWTTDLTTGLGLEGVTVELYSVAGKLLFTARSDKEGLTTLPGALELTKIAQDLGLDPKTELNNSNAGVFIVAKYKDQTTLWNLAWDDGFEWWNVNLKDSIKMPFSADTSLGFVLSAQPIYKPTDEIRLKLIGRQAGGEQLLDLPAASTVKVLIVDPHTDVFYETNKEISSYGTTDLRFKLPDVPKLGYYSVFVSTDPNAQYGPDSENPYIYSNPSFTYYGGFQVENFRAPSFDLTFSDLPEESFNGDKISVAASAQYHFGAPVKGQPVNYSVGFSESYDFSIPGLTDFSLVNYMTEQLADGDYSDEYQEPYNSQFASGEGTLDEKGLFSFDFTIEPEARPRPRQVNISLGAVDVDSRNVSKFTSFLAHPAALYAGLKARSFFAQSGYAQSFDLVAASPDGALQPADVTLTLYRRNWTTVRRRGPGSTYLYSSQVADEKIEEIALKTSDAVAEFQFTPPKSGYYWVKAALKDSKGNDNEASVTFYALGDDSVGWLYSNDDSLTIVSDKPEYAAGDTAKILVQSP
ncbi:MAG: hypothetical protein LBT62_09020, partial [Deltaproteobacteria bacterium]|nr:hypothetical protein [Deltaproteobacteria bacterium]